MKSVVTLENGERYYVEEDVVAFSDRYNDFVAEKGNWDCLFPLNPDRTASKHVRMSQVHSIEPLTEEQLKQSSEQSKTEEARQKTGLENLNIDQFDE